MNYLILFFAALALSLILVPLVKKFARTFGVVDRPGEARKIHTTPIPLLGGFAIFASFVLVLVFYLNAFHPNYLIVPEKFFSALVLGGLILMVGGYIDDKYVVPPKIQIIFPALASLIVVLSGIGVGITFISNPFGGAISLSFAVLGIPFSAIFIFLYILGMIYTTKFLDGMDGLASGISFIASFTLFVLSLTPKINQSVTASLAIIFCGSILGFLVYNFNPASIFLGEAGSTFLGFLLGTLSVLLGGKIATAVLVMGIPILDVAWVITRRLWYGVSPFKADRKHLHFRLLDIGFSQRETVFTLYLIAAFFGLMAIFLQALGKLIALFVLLVVMLILALGTVIAFKRKHPHIPE